MGWPWLQEVQKKIFHPHIRKRYFLLTLCCMHMVHHVRRNGTEWEVCFYIIMIMNITLFINKSPYIYQTWCIISQPGTRRWKSEIEWWIVEGECVYAGSSLWPFNRFILWDVAFSYFMLMPWQNLMHLRLY